MNSPSSRLLRSLRILKKESSQQGDIYQMRFPSPPNPADDANKDGIDVGSDSNSDNTNDAVGQVGNGWIQHKLQRRRALKNRVMAKARDNAMIQRRLEEGSKALEANLHRAYAGLTTAVEYDFIQEKIADGIAVMQNQSDIKGYTKSFRRCFETRVVTVLKQRFVEIADDGHDPMFLRRNTAPKILAAHVIEIEPAREFAIQLKLKNGFWCDLFEIKESTIQGAGLGLFAARKYYKGCSLGVYVGKILTEDVWKKKRKKVNDVYGFLFKDRKRKTCVVDPTISTKRGSEPLAYFGLHYANDPAFGLCDHQRYESPCKDRYNFEIGNHLDAYAIRDILKGEELFLNYHGPENTRRQ
jgi:hypothetical protein